MMMICVGIDPDVSKSGVAYYEKGTCTLELSNLTFFELFEYLNSLSKESTLIIIEASWLIKSNWHTNNKGKNYNAQIGSRTGANHEVGRKIVEMCEYLRLNYKLVKPTKSKLNSETFNKITKYNKRTNQEQRYAAMLVFGN